MATKHEESVLRRAAQADQRARPLIDDPPARERRHFVVSADDHVLESPDAFEGRLPARFADRAPRVIEDETGMQLWQFEDERVPILGVNAIVSWAVEDRYLGPIRYDQIRRATWDSKERLQDMDIDGVHASLCFPSMVVGFAGQRFSNHEDKELGHAVMQAYNDWHYEQWVGADPNRFIPNQVTWLPDPELAAAEIRRNAERGFRSVAFTENPEKLGYPSIYTDHWDPFFRACEETGTVINLHVGSSSETLVPSTETPSHAAACLFPLNAFAATVDWLFANIPIRYPDLRIVLSESGIGWLPMLFDRLTFTEERYHESGLGGTWTGGDLSPSDAVRRNFFFTCFYDPNAFQHIDQIGVEKVMFETDYPHNDTSWPNSQDLIDSQTSSVDEGVVERFTHRNAEAVYRVGAGALGGAGGGA